MAKSREEMLIEEARRRGLVPERKQKLVEEAKKRGLVSDKLPEGNYYDAASDVVFNLGMNTAGLVGSGLAGATVAPFKGSGEATRTIESVQDKAAEIGSPQTQKGTEALEMISQLAEYGVDVARIPLSGLAAIGELISGQGIEQAAETIKRVQDEGFGKTVGSRVYEETENPVAATVGEVGLEGLAALYPVGRMVKAGNVAKAEKAGQIAARRGQQMERAGDTSPALVDDVPDSDVAKYTVTADNRLLRDPAYKPLVKKGFNDGTLASVKSSTDVDKQQMLKMLDIKRRALQNSRYAASNRPLDVVGDSINKRLNYVRGMNTQARQKLDKVAKGLQGKTVDFSGPVNQFLQDLDDMGIKFDQRTLKAVYEGSDIENLKAPINDLNNIINRLKAGRPGRVPDAYDLHRVKKYIDEISDYGGDGQGLKGKVERVIKGLRHNIDELLDSNFDEYNRVNTQYADTIEALNAVQDATGKKVDLTGKYADKSLGRNARKLLTNYQSREQLMDALDLLDDTATKYGGTFKDDVITQVMFANELDDVFGASAQGSLRGIMESAAQTGNKSMKSRAIDAGKSGINKLLGKDDQEAFKLIERLLSDRPDRNL